MTALRTRNWLVPIMTALIGAAWAALYAWEQGPYGRYLDHGSWRTDLGIAGTICRALPGGAVLLPALLYTGGWLLMSSAMMLPTALPLVRRFDRVLTGRSDRAGLIALLIVGYLLAWLGFGVAAHLLDEAVHGVAGRSRWLIVHAWMPGAVLLAVAGGFQFTRLKYRCLNRCRTPLSFVVRHWHGIAPRRDAFLLGLDHGVFCVGCCWAIMLLMFVVGTGNVGWMLALGAVMATEKNAAWGRWLSQPLGIALLIGSTIIVAANAGDVLG